MTIIAIIPARMGSSRLPGKPLADINGTPMLGHVYFRCKKSKLLDEVYIATCDSEIQDYANSIHAKCIMTSDDHERCSDRTAEAMLKIENELGKKVDIIVMVQGDEPMITAGMIEKAIQPLLDDDSINIVNLMSELQSVEEFEDPNEVKVVVGTDGNAIYFSREPIPSLKKGAVKVPMLKQVCVIPFRRDYLLRFNALASTPLERYESVDMLRVIEHGDKVKMVKIDEISYSVDTLDDLFKVSRLMNKECLA